MRVYAHHRHTTWYLILPRAENVINATEHRSTGCCPVEFYEKIPTKLQIKDELKPASSEKGDVTSITEAAARKLKQRAMQRKEQTKKYGIANRYEPGSKVWIKLHKKSEKIKKETKKFIYCIKDLSS